MHFQSWVCLRGKGNVASCSQLLYHLSCRSLGMGLVVTKQLLSLFLSALYTEQWAQAIWHLCPHCGF